MSLDSSVTSLIWYLPLCWVKGKEERCRERDQPSPGFRPRLDRGDGLHQSNTLRTLHQDAIVPLDAREPGLTVRIEPVRRLVTRHLGDDGELHRLTISLETDGGERIITHHEHREDVVVLLAVHAG